ncbi:hypothetical protein [Streptomyces sp. NBC_00209]|uniref:hypothetical protein n=1 Tax=Streptomyces sp. NBC_00209 TaxID=2975682 RepID=UPI00324D9CEC
MTTSAPAPPESRVPPPPSWAVRAAHVAAWSTVPSGVWRVALVLGVPVGVMERDEFLAASLGAFAVMVLWWVLFFGGLLTSPSPDPGISVGEVLFVAAYGPLLLRGPFLAAVTWSYHRRHKACA